MLEKHPPVKKTVEIKECGLCPGMEFSVKVSALQKYTT